MKTLVRILALSAVVATAACSGVPSQYQQYQYTATGAALGAAAGALVGNEINDGTGALVGGTAGAVVGGAIGRSYDQQRYYGYQGNQGGYYDPRRNTPPPSPQASSYPYPNANPYPPTY